MEDYPALVSSGFIVLMVAWFMWVSFPWFSVAIITISWIFVLPAFVALALYYFHQEDYGPQEDTRKVQELLPVPLPASLPQEGQGVPTPESLRSDEPKHEAPREDRANRKQIINIRDSLVIRSNFSDKKAVEE